VLRIVAVALALVVELLLTRTLGQEQYGVLSIGLSWLLILSLVASFGMDTALVRFIPDDLVHERFSQAAGRISYALRAMVSSGVVVGATFPNRRHW
jgi:O-antigen/teichoic acid export membrane protein